MNFAVSLAKRKESIHLVSAGNAARMLVVQFSTAGPTGKLLGSCPSQQCTRVDMLGAPDLVVAFINFLGSVMVLLVSQGWVAKVVWGT